MPRKYNSTARFLKPDEKYDSTLAAKFINCLMWDGKKTASRRIFYDALDLLSQKVPGEPPIEVFTTAITNVKPIVEVRSKRVGGATLQVPHEIKRERQQTLAFRWLIDAVRKKKGKPTARIGKVLDVLRQLGLEVHVTAPDGAPLPDRTGEGA